MARKNAGGDKTKYKVQRPLWHLVKDLQEHTRLLREWVEKVQAGDDAYLGSIAAVLRTLVVESAGRSHRPLLLDLYQATGHTSWVTIAGPPEIPYKADDAGKRYPLAEWMKAPRYFHKVDEKWVDETPEQFVRTWAEQKGLAHQGWEFDRTFAEVHEYDRLFTQLLGISMLGSVLLGIAETVLVRAESYLDILTEDLIDAAQARIDANGGQLPPWGVGPP